MKSRATDMATMDARHFSQAEFEKPLGGSASLADELSSARGLYCASVSSLAFWRSMSSRLDERYSGWELRRMAAPPKTWLLSNKNAATEFDEPCHDLAKILGGTCALHTNDFGEREAVFSFTPDAVYAADEKYAFGAEIDAPASDHYTLRLRLLPPDDDYDSPRLHIAFDSRDLDDNWAAFGLSSSIARNLARHLHGVDISGDHPPWLAAELLAAEAPLRSTLPAIPIRSAALFPGTLITFNVGRPGSVATLDRLIAAGQTAVVALLQRVPSDETPSALAEFYPIAGALRVIRVVRQAEDSYSVIAKGVARVAIEEVTAAATGELEVRLREIAEPSAPADLDVAELRDLAAADPLITEQAGVATTAATETLAVGALCDHIAKHGGEWDAFAPVLQAVDIVERVGAIRAVYAEAIQSLSA